MQASDPTAPVGAANRQDARRKARESAVKKFNELAKQAKANTLGYRPSAEAVQTLFKLLCASLPAEARPALRTARAEWVDNGGGGELPEHAIPSDEAPPANSEEPEHASTVLEAHRILPQTFYATSRKEFRLCSKAFLLTFNNLAFANTPAQWNAFLEWVKSLALAFEHFPGNVTL